MNDPIKVVIDRLQGLVPAVAKHAAAELYVSAEEVMTSAKEETPVDTGNLRASGHVAEPVIEADTVSVTLGFGGPAGAGNQGGETNSEDVGYAQFVHDDLSAHHPVGNAKFLESPLLAAVPQIKENVAGAIAKAKDELGLK